MGQTIVVGLLLAASAQVPATDTIARQLESAEARTVAWGAFNAGAYHRDDLIARLQWILEAPPATERSEERALIAVVMDSLIQLNARVPARLLMPYIDTQRVQTMVLLSNAIEREDPLVDLLPRVSGFQWFAAADILVGDRSPALAIYLIQTVRLHLTVHVADLDGAGLGGANGGGRFRGCAVGVNPTDYPPHAEYRFEIGPSAGLFVLATGPYPVYYSRTVTSGSSYGVSRLYMGGPSDDDRLAYLRAMLLDTGGNPFRADTDVTVRWSTADALVARVDQLRSEVERRFRDLVDLARHYYPVPLGLTVDPPIDVRLVDGRTDQTVPLPGTWPVMR